MGRKKKLVNDKKVRFNITLTPLQKEQAVRIAEQTGTSISEICGTAIEKEFKRLARKQGKSFSEGLPIPGQMTIDDITK